MRFIKNTLYAKKDRILITIFKSVPDYELKWYYRNDGSGVLAITLKAVIHITAIALGLILIAAVAHATWNLFAKRPAALAWLLPCI